jgi:hypothetical protein
MPEYLSGRVRAALVHECGHRVNTHRGNDRRRGESRITTPGTYFALGKQWELDSFI